MSNPPSREPTASPPQTAGDISHLGEGRIYSLQADQAGKAMSAAVGDAMGHLGKAVDPRHLVRRYPWPAVGAAAGVGFLMAWALKSGPRQQAANRLRTLERVLRDESLRNTKAFSTLKEKTGTNPYLKMGLRLAKPVLLSFASSALGGVAGGAAGVKAEENAAKDDPDVRVDPPPSDPT